MRKAPTFLQIATKWRSQEPLPPRVDRRVHLRAPIHRVFVDLRRGDCVLEGEADPAIDRALFARGATWMTASEDFPQFRSDHLGTESDTTHGAHLCRELTVIAHEETRPNDVRRHFRLPGLVCTQCRHVRTALQHAGQDEWRGGPRRREDDVGSCDRGYEIVNRLHW